MSQIDDTHLFFISFFPRHSNGFPVWTFLFRRTKYGKQSSKLSTVIPSTTVMYNNFECFRQNASQCQAVAIIQRFSIDEGKNNSFKYKGLNREFKGVTRDFQQRL